MKAYKRIRQIGALITLWGYDVIRFTKYLNYIDKDDTLDKIKGTLTMNYHVIEKGLTMPAPRLGFGLIQLQQLILLLDKYKKIGFPVKEYEYIYSIKILEEYLSFHELRGYQLNADLKNKISNALNYHGNAGASEQLRFSTKSYFEHKTAEFSKLSQSRYSVRNYRNKEISDVVIKSCIESASKSPSSCNRQPVRAYFVKNKELITNALNIQHGNRGFGHLAECVIVITTNISAYQDYTERHELALNAGMFSMSLMLALFEQEIASCPLNWSVKPREDKMLATLLGIPNNEMINLLITCGYTPEEFSVACSPRVRADKYYRIIR